MTTIVVSTMQKTTIIIITSLVMMAAVAIATYLSLVLSLLSLENYNYAMMVMPMIIYMRWFYSAAPCWSAREGTYQDDSRTRPDTLQIPSPGPHQEWPLLSALRRSARLLELLSCSPRHRELRAGKSRFGHGTVTGELVRTKQQRSINEKKSISDASSEVVEVRSTSVLFLS